MSGAEIVTVRAERPFLRQCNPRVLRVENGDYRGPYVYPDDVSLDDSVPACTRGPGEPALKCDGRHTCAVSRATPRVPGTGRSFPAGKRFGHAPSRPVLRGPPRFMGRQVTLSFGE